MFFKKKVPENCLITIPFSKDSYNIDVICSITKLTQLVKDHEADISDCITSINRLIPDKYKSEQVQLQVWFIPGAEGGVKTTMTYPRKLNKYLKVPSQLVCDQINVTFADLIKLVIMNGLTYGK